MTLDEARKELADYAADEFPGIWDQVHLQQCVRVVLAALPTWRAIADGLPPIGAVVLVRWEDRPKWNPMTMRRTASGAWSDEDSNFFPPSHWMYARDTLGRDTEG